MLDRPTKGTKGINGERMIAVRFDQEMFKEIAAEAHASQRSFAAQVRYYVALGKKAEQTR